MIVSLQSLQIHRNISFVFKNVIYKYMELTMLLLDLQVNTKNIVYGSLTRVPCHEPEAQSTMKLLDYVNIVNGEAMWKF